MPIILPVDRRGWAARLTLTVIYTLLVLGSITMVYPFLLMISTSLTGNLDKDDYTVLPYYLRFWDREQCGREMLLKFAGWKSAQGYPSESRIIVTKYRYTNPSGKIDIIKLMRHDLFESPYGPKWEDPRDPHVRKRVADWYAFKKSGLPRRFLDFYFRNDTSVGPLQVAYQRFLQDRYGEDIDALNAAYAEENDVFRSYDGYDTKINVPIIHSLNKFKFARYEHPHGQAARKLREFWEWHDTLDPEMVRVAVSDPYYQNALFIKYGNVHEVNRVLGTDYASIFDVRMPETVPHQPGEAKFWMETWVQQKVSQNYLELIESDTVSFSDLEKRFHRYLEATYRDVETLNRMSTYIRPPHDVIRHRVEDFSEVKLARRLPDNRGLANAWSNFVISGMVPAENIKIDRIETRYAQFLRDRYRNDIQALNREYGKSYGGFDDVVPPYLEQDLVQLHEEWWRWLWFFVTQNYVRSFDFLFGKARAILNTLILCFVSIVIHITVNPLAAYALSRYRLSYAHKILLVFLATMAFPHEVAMIPHFLLIKHFGFLNTYWAILLPGMANGYFIFLLKGFFDSLPEELFEAARIDGAGELRMFWQMAVPVCKPIFAVISLESFKHMYGMFMFAVLVCQKEEMWTIMVFIHQFMQTQGTPGTIMAVLVIAAMPTLLVFLFAQRTIIRGMIIPQMH